MKKLLFLLFLMTALSVTAQSVPVTQYESPNYSIAYPKDWKATDDSGIINIFPPNQIGAVTISEYHDLNLPKTETKKFILALYKSGDDEKIVTSRNGRKGYTEYFYEYNDDKEKLVWLTKVYQKEKDLYLISVNCSRKYWNGNYMKLFKEAFESFQVKK